jgi:3-hydroxy acid dehydrogenase / malonic semialdehyde reductase
MSKTVFITGATSGFGKALAHKFAAQKDRLILTGRRASRLDELQHELQTAYGATVHTLCFDVQDKTAVFKAIEELPATWKSIDILINNAGLALGRDYFEDADIADWEIMIDTNVKGLLYVSKAIVPYMIERRQGHIVNIGSIAGKEVYEKGNGYCASKYAVDAITKAMRADLLRHKIKVTGIHPGAAETEFALVRFKGNEAAADKVYEGYQPLTAEDVAEVTWFTTTLPPHVCINDLALTCTAQANSFYLYRDI